MLRVPNAYTGRENTAYYARILKKDVSLSIDVLSDILQHSIFDSVEFHKEQFVILQKLAKPMIHLMILF